MFYYEKIPKMGNFDFCLKFKFVIHKILKNYEFFPFSAYYSMFNLLPMPKPFFCLCEQTQST